MQTASFELAPASRRHDWDKALAFAIAPAAPTFAAIYFFAGGLGRVWLRLAVYLYSNNRYFHLDFSQAFDLYYSVH